MRNTPIHRRPARGIAEIELLLCILVLTSLLFVVTAGAYIGMGRMSTVEDAAYRALGNAATGQTPLYTNDSALTEVTQIADVRPGLPNRTHVVYSQKDVPIFLGSNQDNSPVTVKAFAGAISPAWTFSAYPVGGADYSATESWFETYVTESHSELVDPLLLAQPWTP